VFFLPFLAALGALLRAFLDVLWRVPVRSCCGYLVPHASGSGQTDGVLVKSSASWYLDALFCPAAAFLSVPRRVRNAVHARSCPVPLRAPRSQTSVLEAHGMGRLGVLPLPLMTVPRHATLAVVGVPVRCCCGTLVAGGVPSSSALASHGTRAPAGMLSVCQRAWEYCACDGSRGTEAEEERDHARTCPLMPTHK